MTDNIMEAQQTEENLSEILQIRRDKLKKLQDEGRDPFAIKFKFNASTDIKSNYETMENQTVSLAGRIMSKRHGQGILLQDSKAAYSFI